MKLRGFAALAAIALIALNANSAVAKNQPEDIFSSTSLSQITIHLSTASAGKISASPKVAVPATFDIKSDNGISFTNLPIDFHLKGTSTLVQNPSLTANRPSIRVVFHPGGFLKLGFLGNLKSLTLNSMSQDASKIHEYSAYKLYNAMNVPAPRVGYAKITVDIGGRSYDKGLFAIIEPYDETFASARFATHTQHIYEPCNHWTDVTKAGAAKGGADCTNSIFEVKSGWSKAPNKLDLKALAEIQKLKGADWWQAMQRYTDRSEFVRMWAVENFISAWDSYSGAIVNNYYLRTDNLGVFTMMPTGPDETFEYNFKMDALSIGYPLIYSDFKVQSKGRGYMFTRCLQYQPCLNEYLDDLKAAKAAAAKIDLVGKMKAIATFINSKSTDGSIWAQQAAENWVGMKGQDVVALLKKYGR